MQRLDELTQKEAQMANAEALKTVRKIEDGMKDIGEKVEDICEEVQYVSTRVESIDVEVQDFRGEVQDFNNKVGSVIEGEVRCLASPLYSDPSLDGKKTKAAIQHMEVEVNNLRRS